MNLSQLWQTCCLTLGLVACTPTSPTPPNPPTPTVEPDVVSTEAGQLRGVKEDGVTRFLGVPYAAPPVGALRWRPPQPTAPWDGVRDAKTFGSACVQSAAHEGPGDEDCLFLNVWSPEIRAAAPRPVMVYIHGGGWARGAGNMSVFDGIANMQDGQNLARRDGVVVVTLNYRLANLGFLAHPALAEDGGAAGNYGVMDAIAALGWVQRNIRELGGDPQRVLVFGTSAGGSMTCAVAASPLSRGLFSAAASHSGGGCDCFGDAQKLEVATLVADRVGCSRATDIAACLRNVPASTFVALPGVGATADGRVLPSCPLALFGSGVTPNVPLVFGTNVHEGIGYLGTAAYALTSDSLRALFVRAFGTAGTAVADTYSTGYDNPTAAWVAFVGDWLYHCPDRRVLRALAGRTAPTYRYLFAGALLDSRHAAKLSTHGVDVPFVFRNFGTLTTTPAELTLSDRFASRWSTFVAQGTPSGEPSWPKWDSTAPVLGLGLAEVVVARGFRNTECDVLDRVPALREQPSDALPFP